MTAPIATDAMPTRKATDFVINITADLQKWRTFVVISEAGSLTRAALSLDSNQSLLSRQLNALERECGARLFNRTGRGVELSDIGQRLLPQVMRVLSEAETLEHEVLGEAHEPTGRVTLGFLPSIAQPLVGKLYTGIRERHPSISLKVLEGSSGQVEEWLVDARVDIAILYRYGPTLSDSEQSLAVVDSYLIGAPGDRLTRRRRGARSTSCDELPFILPSAPNGLRTALDSMARHLHLNLSPAVEADSLPLQKSLTAKEGLYTVLPLHAVWDEVVDGRLQAAKIVGPVFQRTIAMAFSRSKGPARAVTAVASQIVEIVGAMAHAGMWQPSPPT